MGDATRHVGLDLGGTNIKWAIVERAADAWPAADDMAQGRAADDGVRGHAAGADEGWQTLDQGQVPTDVSGGERTVVPQLARLAIEVRDRVDGPVASLGVAVPGLYIPETGVVTFLTNVPGDWSATPVGEPLEEASGLATALINDARAFGLAELRFGAGRAVGSFIGLTLGTGIGGVFAIGNQVVQGYRGQAGELGHQTIDPDGAWCGCGDRGCVEAYTRADQVARLCGTDSPQQAIERARTGDERARAGFAEIGRYLGIGIANAITVLTPDLVILGGGWSSAGELIIEPIKAELRRRVITTPVERVDVVLAELGTWAGAIGAAVHGAERAAAAATASGADRGTSAPVGAAGPASGADGQGRGSLLSRGRLVDVERGASDA